MHGATHSSRFVRTNPHMSISEIKLSIIYKLNDDTHRMNLYQGIDNIPGSCRAIHNSILVESI